MKNLILSIFCASFSIFSHGQLSIEAQTGGSNFLGTTLNAGYRFTLIEEYQLSINPYIGLGLFLPVGYGPASIVHGGLEYQLYNWGLGAEASGFFVNPFFPNTENGFIDLLIYPKISYQFMIKRPIYLKFSTGLYFAFSQARDFSLDMPEYDFEGDIIPGLEITLGYRFGQSTQ